MASSKWLQVPENRAKHDAYMREYSKEYEKRPEVKARRALQYPKKKEAIINKYRNNPEFRKERIKYGMEKKKKKQIEIAGRAPPDLCEICNNPQTPGRFGLYFDHCHKTGKFRGWICDPCNKGLGHARDNPDTLRKMASYLEKANGN